MKNYLYYLYWLLRTLPLRWSFPKYKILSFEDTVNEIVIKKRSISRFGDGEFRLLTKERGIYFQKMDDIISERLIEVLNSNVTNHLVCIPSSFITQKNLKREVKVHWLNFINLKGKEIATAIAYRDNFFGDALITRFFMDFFNKKKVPEKVQMLKKIWSNQDVLFIEGEFSRLGIGNDLFSNAKSIKRVLCPSTNAFEQYAEILVATKKHGKDKLIIIALGPTATVLAYDLAQENYWALDLGHIDIEYSWFLQGAKDKVPVKGKKSAEVSGTENFHLNETEMTSYKKSIVEEIL